MLVSIKRRSVAVCLGLILALAAGAWADPVTEEELTDTEKGALAEITINGIPWAAQRVAALEYILGAVPTAEMPMMIRTLEGRDLYVTWDPEVLEVSLAPRKEGLPRPLVWKIAMPTSVDKGFVPKVNQFWPAALGILTASLVTVISDELLPMKPFVKQVASIGAGVAIGVSVWVLTK